MAALKSRMDSINNAYTISINIIASEVIEFVLKTDFARAYNSYGHDVMSRHVQ